jgi:hypothetical protein
LELPLRSNRIVLLRGVRRSGNTSLFYHTMRRLEASGVAREQIIYVNLQDDRLFPIRAEELDLILQAHAELFPDFQRKPRFRFLAAIQAVAGWERFVRRIHDTERVGIFITGSAPHLLSRQIAPVPRRVGFEWRNLGQFHVAHSGWPEGRLSRCPFFAVARACGRYVVAATIGSNRLERTDALPVGERVVGRLRLQTSRRL